MTVNALPLFKRFFIDFGFIWAFCTVFVLLKLVAFTGVTHFVEGNDYLRPVFNGILVAFFSALTCYPAFLLGFRILKSRLWLFVFLLISTFLIFELNLYLTEGHSVKVGGRDILLNGELTLFGILYRILSPLSLMTLWAAYLYFKERTKPKETLK